MADTFRKPSSLQSWIPITVSWTTLPNIFFIEVALNDPDLVQFISTKIYEIEITGTKQSMLMFSKIVGSQTLRGQLKASVWSSGKLKPLGARPQRDSVIVAHCHGVFLLPGETTLWVAVGRFEPANSTGWISAELKEKADALILEHRSKVADFDEKIHQKRKDVEEFGPLATGLVAAEAHFQRPVVTAKELLPLLPRATKFGHRAASSAGALVREATSAITASGWVPSRDGGYAGVIVNAPGRRKQATVTWTPHTGLPSYPEVRWAVQKRIPTALRSPRSALVGNPSFENETPTAEDSAQLEGFDPMLDEAKDALDDVKLDDRDTRKRVDEIRKNQKAHGFEAIAWYQPYHVWNEATWGIYFDAVKLDDLALSFLDDLKSARISNSHSLAALLAFCLTCEHELFHAKVEAALSWLEINCQQPRHLRYKQRVYQALRETPDWLEEALANWSAWEWFNAPVTRSFIADRAPDVDGLVRVVETSLDLSPPGYRDWRLGGQPATWRTFANQLSTGLPNITNNRLSLPLESLLTGPLPYDFQSHDIPLRFIGRGIIADRLHSNPATFNVPPRRELERALKHFGHTLDPSSGKGSHQKWTGPDNRGFTLPSRDPVSRVVFSSFLSHLGIDKATYVRQVRPIL